MKLKLSALLASAAFVFSASANAGLVTLNGVVGTCTGLCSAFTEAGNALTATAFIPDADGVYQGTDLDGLNVPNIELEGLFVPVTFEDEGYADAGITDFGLGVLVPSPTAAAPPVGGGVAGDTEVTVAGGISSGQLVIHGRGTTSGVPVWGVFDLDTLNFTAIIYSTDLDGVAGNGLQPGYGVVASGTFSVSQVPVPGAAWLMGSALLGLAGLRRRK